MGYEVVYDPATDSFAIWSTVVDDWVAVGLKTPEAVGKWFAQRITEPKPWAIVDKQGYIITDQFGSLQFFSTKTQAESWKPSLAKENNLREEDLSVANIGEELYRNYIESIWRAAAIRAKETKKTGVATTVFELDRKTGKLVPTEKKTHKPPLR